MGRGRWEKGVSILSQNEYDLEGKKGKLNQPVLLLSCSTRVSETACMGRSYAGIVQGRNLKEDVLVLCGEGVCV